MDASFATIAKLKLVVCLASTWQRGLIVNMAKKEDNPKLKLKEIASISVSSSTNEVETFGDRLYKILGREPAKTFALRASLTPAAFHKYLKCQSEPTRPVMNAIAETAGVNIEWLATGRGPMRKGDMLPTGAGAVGMLTKTESQPFTITNLEGRQVEFRPSPDLRHIPVLTVEAACGEGTVIPSESIKAVFSATDAWFRRELGANPENLVLIQARGDSMANTIMPEEMVFVDRSCVVEPCDGIWVFRNEEALFIKRLQFFPGRKVEVTSDNPRYKPYTMPITESFALLGQVIAALPLRRL